MDKTCLIKYAEIYSILVFEFFSLPFDELKVKMNSNYLK